MTNLAPAGDAATPTRAAGQRGDLRVDVVDSEAGLAGLAEPWDRLLDSMPRPSPFLAWDWIAVWWRHFGRSSSLRVLVARDADGTLVGAAPLHIVRRRVAGLLPLRSLEFLGYRGSAVCADHLDFLAAPDRRHEVVDALVAALWRRRDWDAAVVADLAQDSAVIDAWRRHAPAHGSSIVRPAETCFYLPLPDTAEALWDGLKRSHPELASNQKRYRRRLQQNHAAQFHGEVPPGQVRTVMAELARLHALARGRKGELGNFARAAYRAFHEELAERLAARGRLYLARLECDGATAAALYGFSAGSVLYYYQSGFDTALASAGVGKVLLGWVIEDAAVRLKAGEFDFLRGEEEYKTRWTSQARRTQTLVDWRRTWAGAAGRWAWHGRATLAPIRPRLAAAWRWAASGTGPARRRTSVAGSRSAPTERPTGTTPTKRGEPPVPPR